MDNIDLPSEYFNEDPTSQAYIDENPSYSLDAIEPTVGTRKSEESAEQSDIPQQTDTVNSSQPNVEGNTINNTGVANNTYNTFNDTQDYSNVTNYSANQYSNNPAYQDNNNQYTTQDINQNTANSKIDNQITQIESGQMRSELDNNQAARVESEQIRPTLDSNQIISEINNIDKKISELQSNLNSISKESKSNFDKVIENDTNNEYYEDNNFNVQENNPVEVVSDTGFGEKQTIKNSIFALNSQKTKLQNLLNTNLTKNNIANQYSTIENDNSSEFTPNFAKPTEESLNKAIVTERLLGGDPVLDSHPVLGDVVIDKKQGSVDNAIKEHGGLHKAFQDSVNNQEFIENYFSNNSNDNTISKGSINNNEFVSNLVNAEAGAEITTAPESGAEIITAPEAISEQELVTESAIPDNSQNISNDTATIISILKDITSQLVSISKNISNVGKGGGSSNSSEGKSNNQTSSYKSQNQSSNSGSTGSTGVKKGSNTMDTGIKGNLPSKEFFPGDFDLQSLGVSNLLSRI